MGKFNYKKFLTENKSTFFSRMSAIAEQPAINSPVREESEVEEVASNATHSPVPQPGAQDDIEEIGMIKKRGRKGKARVYKALREVDTDGYVEVMGPEFDQAVANIQAAFRRWKEGPMTEPDQIEPAKKDIVKYIYQMLSVMK